MIEKQPQILFVRQACRKAATSGPSMRHMISGFMSIDSPCSAYSGEDDEVHARHAAPSGRHQIADALRLPRQSRPKLPPPATELNQPDDHATWRFVQSAETAHAAAPAPPLCTVEILMRSPAPWQTPKGP